MTTQCNKTLRPFIILGVTLLTLTLSGCIGYIVAPSGWPGMAVDQDTIYVANNQAVYALNLSSGLEIWSFSPEDDKTATFYAAPSPAGDLVIVGGYNNVVYALDRTSGIEQWRFTDANDRIVSAPAVAGELILIPSADGRLYALQLSTGAQVWVFPAEESLTQAFWAKPIVDGETIYITSMDHHVYALELSTGQQHWKRDLSGAIADTPALVDGLLLVGTFGAKLYALDAESGTIQWSLDTEGWVWGNPAVSDGVAYFGDSDGVFYVVDIEGGKYIWSEGEKIDGPITSSPALENDMIYIVTKAGTIYARQASTNNPLWQQTSDGQLLSDPLLTGELLLVASLDAEVLVIAYDASTGALRWSFTPEN